MNDDQVIPKPKVCPDLMVVIPPRMAGAAPGMSLQPCVGDVCAKYQACQVMPKVLGDLLDLMRERMP